MRGGFAPLGLSHEKVTSDKQINKDTKIHTSRLLDQLGPEGRVGEKTHLDPSVKKNIHNPTYLVGKICSTSNPSGTKQFKINTFMVP